MSCGLTIGSHAAKLNPTLSPNCVATPMLEASPNLSEREQFLYTVHVHHRSEPSSSTSRPVPINPPGRRLARRHTHEEIADAGSGASMNPDGAINRGDLWNGLLASTWSPASELEKEQTEKVPRYRAKVWAKDLECTDFLRAMEASNRDQPWDAHQAHLARLTKSILELERSVSQRSLLMATTGIYAAHMPEIKRLQAQITELHKQLDALQAQAMPDMGVEDVCVPEWLHDEKGSTQKVAFPSGVDAKSTQKASTWARIKDAILAGKSPGLFGSITGK